MSLVLDVALFVSSLPLPFGFPPLPCYARPWRVAPTARAQVKGSKGEPLLLYTDSFQEFVDLHIHVYEQIVYIGIYKASEDATMLAFLNR